MTWRPLVYAALGLAPFLAFGLFLAAARCGTASDRDGDQP